MDSTVTAAAITGFASVTAAWLAHRTPEQRKRLSPIYLARTAPRRWVFPCLLIIAWMAFTPGWGHHDMAGNNIFFIPGFLVITALIRPIRPLSGAAIDLGLTALNFIVGPLSNIMAGSMYDTTFIWSQQEGMKDWTLLLGIIFGGAAAVWLVCLLGIYFRGYEREAEDTISGGSGSLAHDLSALAELRASGRLSEEEFAQSKRKLLGS